MRMESKEQEKETLLNAASLTNELNKLKDENNFLKELMKDNPSSLHVEQVIRITQRIGTGTNEDPVREVYKLWTIGGKFITSLNSYPL